MEGGIARPAFVGTPTRARRPACLVPEHWIHSLTPRFVRGFRVLQAPPSSGGLTRLSPQAAHDERNPGRLGFRLCRYATIVPTILIPKLADFVGFCNFATLDILDNFWTMSKMSK